MDKKNGIPNSVYLTNNVYVRFFYDPNYRPIRNEFELIWENDVSLVASLDKKADEPHVPMYCTVCKTLIGYGSNKARLPGMCAKCSPLQQQPMTQKDIDKFICNKCGKSFVGNGPACFSCMIKSVSPSLCTMCGKDISKASSVEVGSCKCIECIMKTMAHMQEIIDRSIKAHSEKKQ